MLPRRFYDDVGRLAGVGLRNEGVRKHVDRTYDLDTLRESGASVYISCREAVRQAVSKVLCTERFKFPVYSGNYGIELEELFGRDREYVCAELERRISEALLVDDRIERLSEFEFVSGGSSGKAAVYVSFIAHTVFGEVKMKEVGVYV